MATLSIINTFSLDSNGQIVGGKQGSADDLATTPFDITVTGTGHYIPFSLLTATVVTIYDDDDDVPANWNYLWLWSDQNLYIQIIGSATNVILPVLAKTPFNLAPITAGLGMLAAANTTAITGGTEPTLTDIDSVVLGNYSGTTAVGLFVVVD
jgi:hypothetical protein